MVAEGPEVHEGHVVPPLGERRFDGPGRGGREREGRVEVGRLAVEDRADVWAVGPLVRDRRDRDRRRPERPAHDVAEVHPVCDARRAPPGSTGLAMWAVPIDPLVHQDVVVVRPYDDLPVRERLRREPDQVVAHAGVAALAGQVAADALGRLGHERVRRLMLQPHDEAEGEGERLVGHRRRVGVLRAEGRSEQPRDGLDLLRVHVGEGQEVRPEPVRKVVARAGSTGLGVEPGDVERVAPLRLPLDVGPERGRRVGLGPERPDVVADGRDRTASADPLPVLVDGEKVRLEGEHVEPEPLVERLDEPGAERDGPAVTVPRLPEQDDAGVADRVEHGVEMARRHLNGRFGNERGSVLGGGRRREGHREDGGPREGAVHGEERGAEGGGHGGGVGQGTRGSGPPRPLVRCPGRGGVCVGRRQPAARVRSSARRTAASNRSGWSIQRLWPASGTRSSVAFGNSVTKAGHAVAPGSIKSCSPTT